jgi:branched-chain amino acid transport system substrate-binding protein
MDPTVDSQIVALKASGANVFFNVTQAKFAAMAIRKASEIGWKPAHFLNNVSASVGAVLTPAGLDKSEGIVTALYLKDPTDPQWQADADFKAWTQWMREYYPSGSVNDVFNAFSYASAFTMHQVLLKCGNDLSRENIMKRAANIKDLAAPMLLPGIKIDTAPDDFYPIEQMRQAKFDGQRWVLFGDVIDGRTVQ